MVDRLLRASRDFASTPARLQLLALALLMALAALRYAEGIFDAAPRPDELAYVRAAERLAAGQSPYHGDYVYLPALPAALAPLAAPLGRGGLLALLRAANLLGAAVAIWWSFAWTGLGYGARLCLAALFLVLAEPIRYGLLWGNLSLALAGSLIAAFALWPRRPWLAGLLLGLGVGVKPLAPAAIGALGLHRSSAGRPLLTWPRPWGTAAQLKAAGSATALALSVILLPPYLDEFLALAGGRPAVTRNVSLHRLLHLLGVDAPALLLSALVAATAWALVWTRPLAPFRLQSVAVVLALLATPLVWSHTLLIALPLQVVAATVAIRRWQGRPRQPAARDERLRLLLELVLVAGAIAALLGAQGVGGIDDQPPLVQALVVAPPVLAPAALALYLARRTDPF